MKIVEHVTYVKMKEQKNVKRNWKMQKQTTTEKK